MKAMKMTFMSVQPAAEREDGRVVALDGVQRL